MRVYNFFVASEPKFTKVIVKRGTDCNW